MTDAVAASQAEVAEMRRRQAETDRKQESLEQLMAELMARMNLQAISFKESPSAIPATDTPRQLQHFVSLCPCMLPTNRVGSKRSSRRRSQGGSDWDGY